MVAYQDQIVTALAHGVWSELNRIVLAADPAGRPPDSQKPKKAAAEKWQLFYRAVRTPSLVHVRNPFEPSVFGSLQTVFDWDRLHSKEDVINALTQNHLLAPSSKTKRIPAQTLIVAEICMLVGTYLLLFHNSQPSMEGATTSSGHLLAKILAEDIPAIRSSLLPHGTWRRAFADRCLRIELPADRPAHGSELALCAAVEAIRISHCRSMGLFDPVKIASKLVEGSQTTRTLTEALAAAHATVIEFSNGSAFQIILPSIELLSLYAKELPIAWFSSALLDALDTILRDHADTAATSTEILAPIFTLLLVRAQKSSSQASIHKNKDAEIYEKSHHQAIHMLSRSILSTSLRQNKNLVAYASEALMATIVQCRSALEQKTIDALVVGLMHAVLSPNLLDAFANLMLHLHNMIVQQSICKALLFQNRVDMHQPESLDDLASIRRCFGSIATACALSFDAQKAQVDASASIWFTMLGIRPHLEPIWISRLVEAILPDEYLAPHDHNKTNMQKHAAQSERQLFALLGILDELVRRSLQNMPASRRYIRLIAQHLLGSLDQLDSQSAEKYSILFSHAISAIENHTGGLTFQDLKPIPNAHQIIMAALETILSSSECLNIPKKTLFFDNEADKNLSRNYFSTNAATKRRDSLLGSSLAVIANSISTCTFLLWTHGDCVLAQDVADNLVVFCDDLATRWTASPLSKCKFPVDTKTTKDTQTHDQIELMRGILKHMMRVLACVLGTLQGVSRIVSEEQSRSSTGRCSDATTHLAMAGLRCLSSLHFISSQFSMDGPSPWKQLLSVFCAAVMRNPAAAKDLLMQCAPKDMHVLHSSGNRNAFIHPVDKAHILFFLAIAGRFIRVLDSDFILHSILPVAQTKMHPEPLRVPQGTSKYDVDDLDLFDAAHAVVLRLFEHASKHKSLVCDLAPSYTKTLLGAFPHLIDVRGLRACFSTVVRAFGPSFFAEHVIDMQFASSNRPQMEWQSVQDDRAVADHSIRDLHLKHGVDAPPKDSSVPYAMESSETNPDGSTPWWWQMEKKAQSVATDCIRTLTQFIDRLADDAQNPDLPADNTTSSRVTSAPTSDRFAEIIRASSSAARHLMRDELLLVLFDQLETVPVLLLPQIMDTISAHLVGALPTNHGSLPLSAPTKMDSPIWTGLADVVFRDGQIDYTRRRTIVEWYLNLFAYATEKTLRNAASTELQAQHVAHPQTPSAQLRAKL